MWYDRRGSNFTSAQVCQILSDRAGASYTPALLESAFRVGAIYHNGSIWFQRVQ